MHISLYISYSVCNNSVVYILHQGCTQRCQSNRKQGEDTSA